MKKTIVFFLLLGTLIGILGACSGESSGESDTITMVWYPNESGNDLKSSRDEIASVIEEETGKKVTHQLTTDYAVAIETIANGNADLAFMGAQGYIEANNKSKDVVPVVVPSGESGTLDDAVYYSWLAVREEDASQYQQNGEYTIDQVVGSKFSFVSNSSTSGFKVPSSSIIGYFSQQEQWNDLDEDDLMEGDAFFSEVMYGESHQGSAVNLLMKRADIAAFCDACVSHYVELVEGEENQTGAIYQVSEGAAEPFNTLGGERFVIIHAIPVLNAPFAANMKTLGEENFEKIQQLFISDRVTNNDKIFSEADAEQMALFTRKANEKFVVAEDSWFNPIRELSK